MVARATDEQAALNSVLREGKFFIEFFRQEFLNGIHGFGPCQNFNHNCRNVDIFLGTYLSGIPGVMRCHINMVCLRIQVNYELIQHNWGYLLGKPVQLSLT